MIILDRVLKINSYVVKVRLQRDSSIYRHLLQRLCNEDYIEAHSNKLYFFFFYFYLINRRKNSPAKTLVSHSHSSYHELSNNHQVFKLRVSISVLPYLLLVSQYSFIDFCQKVVIKGVVIKFGSLKIQDELKYWNKFYSPPNVEESPMKRKNNVLNLKRNRFFDPTNERISVKYLLLILYIAGV